MYSIIPLPEFSDLPYRLIVAAVFLPLSVAFIRRQDMWKHSRSGIAICWCYICAIFPAPAMILLLLLLFGPILHYLLSAASNYKASLTRIPITLLDIKITVKNPVTLLHLFNIPKWFVYPIYFTLSLTLIFVIFLTLDHLFFASYLELAETALLAVTAFCLAWTFAAKLVADVRAHIKQKYPYDSSAKDNEGYPIEDWQWEGLPALASQLGAIAFLVYSFKMEAQKGPTAIRISSEKPINEKDTLSAIRSFIKYKSISLLQPNIVVVQCESLFNPWVAFEIEGKIDNTLFSNNEYSLYNGLIRANTTGGGSWISEFEFLTGLDTRVFGYWGYYSHVTISPYIAKGFPSYLKSKGYIASAYIPTKGNFYNSEQAYSKYGIENFFDPPRLGIDNDWAPSDMEMANAFINKSHSSTHLPLFSFIVTNGAHGPYKTNLNLKKEENNRRFLNDSDQYLNSQLNDYFRRIAETEDAIAAVLTRLKEMEAQTGRPFVLAFYGDHQPYPFTGYKWATNRTYDHVRTDISKQSTWCQILSSCSNLNIDIPDEIPLPLLPTILSAFTVNNHSEIYMPQNFAVYRESGPVMFPNLSLPSNIHLQQAGELTDGIHPIANGHSISHASYIASARRNGLFKF